MFVLNFHLNVSADEVKEYIAPIMSKAPVIDGIFDKNEWDEAVGFDGMTSKGKLEERKVRSYVGASSDSLYFAVVSELPSKGTILSKSINGSSRIYALDDAVELFIRHFSDKLNSTKYHLVFNSRGEKYFRVIGENKTSGIVDWGKHCSIKSSTRNGYWTAEIKVPLKAIAPDKKISDGKWSISLCRDWKQPTVFSSAPGKFSGKDCRFKFVNDGLAIQFIGLSDFFAKKIKTKLRIKNTSTKAKTVKVSMTCAISRHPSVDFSKEITIKGGQQLIIPFDASAYARGGTNFKLAVRVSSGKKIYYVRNINWGEARKYRWSTEMPEAVPFDFEFAYYPYKNLMRIRNIFSNYKKVLPEKVRYTIKDKSNGKIIKVVELPANKKEIKFKLAPLNGAYSLTLDLNGKKLRKEFVKKAYKWEHNKLGTSRKVYPPFKDIKVVANKLYTVGRCHELDGTGLPRQININGVDILAAPISLIINGSVAKGKLKFTEKSADVVISESNIVTNGISATAYGRWEYDGCLKYDLKLEPTKNLKIETLFLDIPLKRKYVPMLHAVGDSTKRSVYQYLKKGDGELWNSSVVKSYKMPQNFCSYILLGSPLRALCFFAENDKGWSWNRKTPSVRVIGNGDTVVLRINLINEATTITEARTLSFGLLAAPIKPLRKDWRTSWKYSLIGTCFNWFGGPGICGNVYPFGKDMYFWKLFARGNVEKVPKAEQLKAANKALKYYEKYPNVDLKRKKNRLIGHIDYNLGGRGVGKKAVYYYNRSVYSGLEEYRTFMNEWSQTDVPNKIFAPSIYELMITPSKSYNDFALYWYAESFEYGRNLGVYWDNWSFAPSHNTEMTDAYYNADGTITPATGVWKMRELAKRTFQMMNEKGMEVITYPHTTSNGIMPLKSFATAHLDWEWKYAAGDVQDRHDRLFLMLGSNGMLSGTIPTMISDHCTKRIPKNKREWVQRTFAGVCLTHDLISGGPGKIWKSMRDAIKRSYWLNSKLKTYNYWDDYIPVYLLDKDCTWIVHSIPGKRAVLVLCSYKNRDVVLDVKIDLAKLGLAGDTPLSNIETGERIQHKNGHIKINMKKHEVKAIEFK